MTLGIWGSSSTDVFAVGWDGTICHYNGNSWSEMVSGTTEHLYGIWGSSGTDVFAVGVEGTILHYDGSTWAKMESGTTKDLDRVWGSSETDVFAVGVDGTILHYGGPPCLLGKLYGEDSREVEMLRNFRDNVLIQTPEGQEIIRLYYQWSPVIVKAMEEDEDFEAQVKEMIDGVVSFINEAIE